MRDELIGSRLGHYSIAGSLGAGGMGEVYLAEDTRLQRRVALKVLPDELARDPERLARLEREARSVAALNHPNIVTLHAVEEAAGRKFLVMELVEGQTLEAAMGAGGLPLERFFRLAIPLADAVATAHRRGIVHRDLKPSNVMVTPEDRIKVLDFGLAKPQPQSVDEVATMTAGDALTREGAIVGTVAYMAPEQLRGEAAEARSDVFALGCILYQMATGRRPFAGRSGPDLVSAILRDDPAPADELRPELPRHLARILGLCLKKAPDERLQSALDLRNELRELQAELATENVLRAAGAGPRGAAAAKLPIRRVAVAAIALLAALAAAWLSWSWLRERGAVAADGRQGAKPPTTPPEATRRLTQLTSGAAVEEWPAWSPDGSRLVYSADVGGYKNLFLRQLAGGEVTRLTEGRRDDIQAAWFPDGRRLLFVRSNRPDGKLQPSDVLGYFSDGDTWLLDLEAGSELRLLEDAVHPAVSPAGDAMAFDASWAGPRRIWIADARGRNPRQLTTDISEETLHTAPHWSPAGDRLVFRLVETTHSDVAVVELASGEHRRLTDDEYSDLHPVWSPSGRMIYFPSYRGGGMNLWRLPLTAEGAAAGPPAQVTTGAGQDVQVAVSPDGDRLAFAVLQLNADLWRLPLDPTSGRPTGDPEPLLATTREESRGSWSPDSQAIAFNSDRDGPMNLYLLSLADDSVRQVTSGPGGDYQPQWSPDGSSLAFFSTRSGNVDVWTVDLESGALRQLTDDPGLDLDPFWSPDGRRVAFHSDRSGRLEVWVVGADGSGPRQLTTVGAKAHFLRWSRDGREIFFTTSYSTTPEGGPANVLAVDVASGATRDVVHAASGGHLSLGADDTLLLDATGHHSLWIYPLSGAAPYRVFAFPERETRIDYPVWSPDGRFVSFDRVHPRGGDVWLLEGLGEAR
ncbi:MAG TPA: protein kinase [Thermoanaerobaculia bacterium]|nr:protein kinase [Thermoanaerobaculia bacterium]